MKHHELLSDQLAIEVNSLLTQDVQLCRKLQMLGGKHIKGKFWSGKVGQNFLFIATTDPEKVIEQVEEIVQCAKFEKATNGIFVGAPYGKHCPTEFYLDWDLEDKVKELMH